MLSALKGHWPEYLMEAAGLGLFMISACGFGVLLGHPASPVAALVPDGLCRRALMGLAMGGTAVALIFSPWGKQSGAHLNPSVTLAFLRLGKIRPWDAMFYIVAQFAGGLAGVLLSRAVEGEALADPPVRFVVTEPGPGGAPLAFGAEVVIAFVLMTTVLVVSNSALERWTGVFAGALVASYIAFEAPLSGMSLNPARTVASALPAMSWTALWIYLVAPPFGMLAAAIAFAAWRGRDAVRCAKLHHENPKRCIFCGRGAALEV
jgi:aquaporin Z